MVKIKRKRSLQEVGEAQQLTEKISEDKFAETQEMIVSNPKKMSHTNKPHSRLTFSIGHEEQEMLDAIALHASNKQKKVINTSAVIRSLIRYGFSKIDDLEM